MKSTLKVFGILLVASFVFYRAMIFMVENIEDFESVPLPPKKVEKITTRNPVLRVDATSRESWTLVDFSTGRTYRVTDPDEEKGKLQEFPWDLGFQRTKIISNSGVTNPQGRVGILNLGPVDFDSVREIPPSKFTQDTRFLGVAKNEAVSDWYNYRTRTHNVESRKNVYVVKTASGRYLKLRILNYYCTRADRDCRTLMCSRDEAACLTVEYVLALPGKETFPAPSPAPAQIVMKTEQNNP